MFMYFSEHQQLFGKICKNVIKILPFFYNELAERHVNCTCIYGRHHVNMVLSRYNHPSDTHGIWDFLCMLDVSLSQEQSKTASGLWTKIRPIEF